MEFFHSLKEFALKRIYIPMAWELAFVIATIIWPKQAFHLFFGFYSGLLIYFYFIYKQFSFRKLHKNFGKITRGEIQLWKKVE